MKCDVHSLAGFVSTAYLDDEPGEDGIHLGEWKYTGAPLRAWWNDTSDRWEEIT